VTKCPRLVDASPRSRGKATIRGIGFVDFLHRQTRGARAGSSYPVLPCRDATCEARRIVGSEALPYPWEPGARAFRRLGGIAPATNKRFVAEQSHWYRVADGKLREHWATRDDLSAMLQLGVIHPPGPPRNSG
jgi:hypothetical protein